MGQVVPFPCQGNDLPHPGSADEIVVTAQEILAAFLEPNSGITPEQCVNSLLLLLDGPEAVDVNRLWRQRNALPPLDR